MTTPSDYTYDHVTTKVMMEDMAFGDEAPPAWRGHPAIRSSLA